MISVRRSLCCVYILGLALLPTALHGINATPHKIRAIYNSLDPRSISQHLAFYELYPQSNEGRNALSVAWQLMQLPSRPNNTKITYPFLVEQSALSEVSMGQTVHAIIALVNNQPDQKASELNEEALAAIEHAARGLHNRKLKGHYATTEAEVLSLPSEEIDLAHAIFLSQQNLDSEALKNKKNYEAAIDLMALQICARLPNGATPEQMIRTMNDFIFYELGFRFPPHSLYAKEIDRYTFLSSVIDSRRGICLGVSVLYLALAQRLGLPLEIVTPPGHIYVRYRDGNKVINIETTARGINVESSEYLSIDTFALEERNIKETVGLVHFNQAADDLRTESFEKALSAYEKAKLYNPYDNLIDELMGTCSILCGKVDEGKRLLQKTLISPSKHQIGKNPNCEDYLNGYADANALKSLFLHTEDNHESIQGKQKVLQEIISQQPRFRSGLIGLAMTWIQLQRFGEALEFLEKYHAIDPSEPKVEYYLAVIYAKRYNFPKAWEHLKIAEEITRAHGHFPKVLKEFREDLSRNSPE
ncbi:MAG: hypothetical protein H0W50_08355 [Parachlamydiaceae bacterium]|nr:hypothetical protein [Parachlamydiaceae bacterium]